MEGRLLLKNCSILRPDGGIRTGMAIAVEDGRIRQVVPDTALPVKPGDWEVACRGRVVTPGLVDCHAHLVSGQLLPFNGELLIRPQEVRAEVRQRLESLLTAEDVEVLTRHALAKAARVGVTLVAEHLYAPSRTLEALEAQAKAAAAIGIRAVISHATRSHSPSAVDQLEANGAFAQSYKNHPLVRGALGFHSSSTADDVLLGHLGNLKEQLGVGVHGHLAQSDDDQNATFSQYGKRVVPRLSDFGLLGPDTVASYAHALDANEIAMLASSRSLVALSPRLVELREGNSETLESLLTNVGLRLGLGTASVGSLWDEFGAALAAVVRLAKEQKLTSLDSLLRQLLLDGPAEMCNRLFGAPSGNVDVGCVADLVVHDLVPLPELLEGWSTSIIYELGRTPVAWTLVGGRVVVREGQLLSSDSLELAAEANARLINLWSRVSSFPSGG